MRDNSPSLQNIPMPGTSQDRERREAIRHCLVKAFAHYSSPLPLDPYAVEQESLRRAWAKTFIGFTPLLDIDYASIERTWAAKITAACPVGSKRRVCMALHNANARIHE